MMGKIRHLPKQATYLCYRIFRKVSGYHFLALCSFFSLLTGKKLIFITSSFGDLGNHLFLFSNLIAFSLQNNAIVINLGLGDRRNHLVGASKGLIPSFPPTPWFKARSNVLESIVKTLAWSAEAIASSRFSLKQWQAVRINNSPSMAFEMIDLDNPSLSRWFKKIHVIFLAGYCYIASKSIRLHQEEIRGYLGLKVNEPNQLINRYREFRGRHDFIIGVLIRHGDYRNFMDGRYFYETSCYVDWIKQVKALTKSKTPGFIITGNDGITPAGLTDVDHIFAQHGEIATRLILSRCDMLISPPSSYAGWCAFSGNIPLLLLTSSDQILKTEDLRTIFDQIDLRDASMPRSIDSTLKLIR